MKQEYKWMISIKYILININLIILQFGNIERDANQTKKYWNFIKLIGRTASHFTLECNLKIRPNYALIGEEVEQKNQSLEDIVNYIAIIVKNRAYKDMNFGIELIPEGLIEFFSTRKKLIQELNDLLVANQKEFDKISDYQKIKFFSEHINKENACFIQIFMKETLHGNIQVSLIAIEQL